MVPLKPLYPERDAEILEWYMSGYTLKEIGEAYGITRERVRQLILREAGQSVAAEAKLAKEAKLVSEGIVTRSYLNDIKKEFKLRQRIFQEREMVWLYHRGLSLSDVSEVVLGRDSPGQVWQVLRKHGVERRVPGHRGIRIREIANYNWEEWLDGYWHEARRFENFWSRPGTFRAMLYNKARDVGRKVMTNIDGDAVQFCFYVPGNADPPVNPFIFGARSEKGQEHVQEENP